MENKSDYRVRHKAVVTEVAEVCGFLALSTGLSKSRIKDAMTKGAVWLKRTGNKEKRLRKATFTLLPGDLVELYYDPEVLALLPPSPQLIAEEKHYSIWYKPANLLTQGTRYGDHCSLIRWVEIFFRYRQEIFLVHRLDREAFGLVLLAHSRQAASAFSRLFRESKIEKRYRAEVHGKIGSIGETITIKQPLDGKEASMTISVIGHVPESNSSTIDILLHTGRFHQIRRHLSGMGHPVIGDPKYGIHGILSNTPLQLCAKSLQFQCPFSRNIRTFSI